MNFLQNDKPINSFFLQKNEALLFGWSHELLLQIYTTLEYNKDAPHMAFTFL